MAMHAGARLFAVHIRELLLTDTSADLPDGVRIFLEVKFPNIVCCPAGLDGSSGESR